MKFDDMDQYQKADSAFARRHKLGAKSGRDETSQMTVNKSMINRSNVQLSEAFHWLVVIASCMQVPPWANVDLVVEVSHDFWSFHPRFHNRIRC